jgi:hypothetical protein
MNALICLNTKTRKFIYSFKKTSNFGDIVKEKDLSNSSLMKLYKESQLELVEYIRKLTEEFDELESLFQQSQQQLLQNPEVERLFQSGIQKPKPNRTRFSKRFG